MYSETYTCLVWSSKDALPLQEGSLFWGTFDFESPAFEWGSDYERPNLPPQDLIVYEMPVRSFTADASSKVGDANQGTFKGVAEKVCQGMLVLLVHMAYGQLVQMPYIRNDALYGRISGNLLIEMPGL